MPLPPSRLRVEFPNTTSRFPRVAGSWSWKKRGKAAREEGGGKGEEKKARAKWLGHARAKRFFPSRASKEQSRAMVAHENEQEFRRTIGLNLALLRLSGAVPSGKGFAGRNGWAFATFTCYSIVSISYVYQFVTNTDDLATVFESFAMVLPVAGSQVRLTILLRLRGSCQKLLATCESLWSMLKPREKKIVASYVGKTKLVAVSYLASCMGTILLYALFALFGHLIFAEAEGAVENATEAGLALRAGERHRRLPYELILEAEESPWYEILYVLQLLVMSNIGFVCVGVDTVGPLFVLVACGCFDAIRGRIEKLRSVESPLVGAPVKSLRICVIHHRMLLEFCSDIERFTNLIFLVQLMSSTYNISLVGFKLVEDSPNKYKYVTQLSFSAIQLLLCSWPADVLLSKSEAIGYAAYLTPWYRYSGSLRKPTSLMIMRGQRPVRLTAGKFVSLSLETFASMMSTAASFFTVVRSTN